MQMTLSERKRIDRYLEICIHDAYLDNQRKIDEDVDFWWICVNNQFLFGYVNCSYERVIQTAKARVQRNIKKNFGVKLPSECFFLDRIFITEAIDINHTRNKFQFVKDPNKVLYLNSLESDRKMGDAIPAYVYEKLLLEHYHITVDQLRDDFKKRICNRYFINATNLDFKEFVDLYTKAIGESPCLEPDGYSLHIIDTY